MSGMKITPEALKTTLEELYVFYFNKAKGCLPEDIDAEIKDKDLIEYTKANEATEAVSAIYLQCFGGREMWKLWTKTAGIDMPEPEFAGEMRG